MGISRSFYAPASTNELFKTLGEGTTFIIHLPAGRAEPL